MTATDLSNAPDWFGPYLFPPLFILLWIGVCHFVAFRGGWKELASVYTSTPGFIGTRYHFQSGRMCGGMNYNNMLTVGTDVYALYLSVFSLFSIGHSPICIPWEEISANFQKGFLGRSVKLEFRRCPNVHIIIGERLSRKLVEGSGGRFRVPEETYDSPRISKTT
ncbi:MAG: hypothetical protein JRF18_02705 [Deltaproteobacteria bacterium]|nr:hypothetical protein [Deltaproteobacteria bacterium]